MGAVPRERRPTRTAVRLPRPASSAVPTSGTPVPGGSLVYGLEADTSGGFCLYKAQLAIGGIQVARTIYDTLTMPGADGKIHPYLAKSVVGTKNNTVWTITLRSGIKFHDGSPLTAQTVKDNLDHYRKDNPLFTFVFADVTAINVVNTLTVQVTTKVPWTAFPWFLWSSSRLGIMAEAQMKSPDCNTKLIGTGPFEFVSWKPGDKFVAKKNPTLLVQGPEDGRAVAVPQPDHVRPAGGRRQADVVARGRRLPDDPHLRRAAGRRRSARTSRPAS